MDCITVCKLLNEYIEDNLTDSVSQALSEHLQKCEQCAAEERLLRGLAAALRSLPQRSAPPDFTMEIMAALAQSDDVSAEASGVLSTLVSRSGLGPAWIGMKMVARSVKFAEYMPRPTVRLRIGDSRSRSLTKLPLALGFRW